MIDVKKDKIGLISWLNELDWINLIEWRATPNFPWEQLYWWLIWSHALLSGLLIKSKGHEHNFTQQLVLVQ